MSCRKLLLAGFNKFSKNIINVYNGNFQWGKMALEIFEHRFIYQMWSPERGFFSYFKLEFSSCKLFQFFRIASITEHWLCREPSNIVDFSRMRTLVKQPKMHVQDQNAWILSTNLPFLDSQKNRIFFFPEITHFYKISEKIHVARHYCGAGTRNTNRL